jgi:hypothetical protein
MAMPETLHGGVSEIARGSPSNGSGPVGSTGPDEALARYLSQLSRMGEQLVIEAEHDSKALLFCGCYNTTEVVPGYKAFLKLVQK